MFDLSIVVNTLSNTDEDPSKNSSQPDGTMDEYSLRYLSKLIKEDKLNKLGDLGADLTPGMSPEQIYEIILNKYQPKEETGEQLILCRHCGQNQVKTRTVQVRSSDEGASTYHECKSCLRRWTE